MKKFLVKDFLFILIICSITMAINMWYMNTISYRQEVITNSNYRKFENVPYDIEICNFGSSHGSNDYFYDKFQTKYTCFNFALPSQSLDYDYRIFEHYKEHISENAIIFITISYMSLYGIDESLYDDFGSKNKRYYHFLPKELIKEYELKTDVFETCLPALVQYDKLLPVLVGKQDDSTEDWTRTADQIDMNEYVSEAYKRHLVRNKMDEYGNRIINKEYVNSLIDMIDMCREINARPILVTTPYLSEYTNFITENSPDFLESFYDLVGKIADQKGVPYYNYAFDDRFYKDYSLFVDADHLNKNGALKFVDILIQQVNNID